MFKDIVENLKSRFIQAEGRRLKKKLNKKFLLFNLKDFISDKHICKMYILVDIKGNCKKSRLIKEERRLLKKI